MNAVTQGEWSVSCTTGHGIEGAILSVVLPRIAGRELPADKWLRGFGDGRAFPSSDAAFQFAFEHGYLKEYFTSPDLRADRKKRAKDQRFVVVSGKAQFDSYTQCHGDFATHALARDHMSTLTPDPTLRVIRTCFPKVYTQPNLF